MSQFWIFFAAGVGGDGLANLLERCHGVYDWAPGPLVWGQQGPIAPTWRVHRIVDGDIKFWAPTPDTDHCFRSGKKFDINCNHLKDSYLQAVQNDRNIVVTSHDVTLRHLNSSDCLEIFTKKQIKILLDSRNYLRCYRQYTKKCLVPMHLAELTEEEIVRKPTYTNYRQTDRSQFDHVVWIEDLASVNALVAFLKQLGLEADACLIHQYLALRSGDWGSVRPTGQSVPTYRSYVENGIIQYHSVDQ